MLSLISTITPSILELSEFCRQNWVTNCFGFYSEKLYFYFYIHLLYCARYIGVAVVHIKMINDEIFFIECILLNINCSADRGRGVK